eukprot:3288588-Alexandrium_andersonii.AAC.1
MRGTSRRMPEVRLPGTRTLGTYVCPTTPRRLPGSTRRRASSGTGGRATRPVRCSTSASGG